MDGHDPAPADPKTPLPSKPNVQCTRCGHIQEFDAEYKICLNCGNAVGEGDFLILARPRTGRGMQGLAILAFLSFAFVFFFWSKFLGRHGMAVSALFYIWGFYRNYLYKREAIGQQCPPGSGAGKNDDPRKP